MGAVHPLPRGLLLERAIDQSNKLDTTVLDVPKFFTLAHPLEELKPVSYFDLAYQNNGSMLNISKVSTGSVSAIPAQEVDTGFVCNPNIYTMFSSPDYPYVRVLHYHPSPTQSSIQNHF
eukprot:TRINITY_DN5613_c0_g1_i1.p2 TRINITY_DN5613_c0_g1~~TRINITY_DN5613_c0_g1_i1.p2  ORF type:complete len:119 (+),score=23.56 TRINITY_DN5613_c0_g1_i1:174-530(+)